MTIRSRLLGAALLLTPALAAAGPLAVASANASADILLPAFAGATEDLGGELELATGGPVVVNPAGGAKARPGTRALSSAKIKLAGASAAAVEVVFSGTPATLTDGRGHSIRADSFTASLGSSGHASGTLDRGSGTQVLGVGATLHPTPGLPPGRYSSLTPGGVPIQVTAVYK